MIPTNELRVGNWVNHLWKKKGYIDDKWAIKQIVPNDIPASVKYPETYEPIPLTDEWLLRFGFKENGFEIERYRIFINKDESIRVSLSPLNVFIVEMGYSDFSIDKEWRIINDTEFVHKFQNLIFALTGEELAYEK